MSNKPNDLAFAYVADGFTDDCDELIHLCAKVDMLKFEYFCDIWKDMQLASIFHGRQSGAELAELSEEVLNVAKSYMVADTPYFEESVAGLFLVYALLNLQPYPGFASVRFVPEDMPAIERLEFNARKQKRHDLLYILGSVLIQGPSQYHVCQRERGMESSVRKYLEGYNSVQRAGTQPKGVFYRQNEESDILRELNGIARRYATAKSALRDKHNLSYTNDDLMSELDCSLKNLISGVYEDGKDEDTEESRSKMDPISIKERAMKSKVQPMKHLVTIESKSPGSPTKKIPPKPKRRSDHKTPPITKCPQNNKKPDSDDSDTEPDLDLDLFSKPETPPPKKMKLSPVKRSPRKKDVEVKKQTDVKQIEIEIDPVPSNLPVEDNIAYETKIIDKLKKKNAPKNKSKLSPTKGEANKKSPVRGSPQIKKKENDVRTFKRSALKSKLNRYGTLPIVETEIEKCTEKPKDSEVKSPTKTGKKSNESPNSGDVEVSPGPYIKAEKGTRKRKQPAVKPNLDTLPIIDDTLPIEETDRNSKRSKNVSEVKSPKKTAKGNKKSKKSITEDAKRLPVRRNLRNKKTD